MKRKTVPVLFLSFAMLLLCSCGGGESFSFQGYESGTAADEMISAMQSQDCYLVSESEFAGLSAYQILGFDTDGTALMSGYVFAEGEKAMAELYALVEQEAVKLWGEPVGKAHQDENGQTQDGWEADLDADDQFQTVWITPEGFTCYLQSVGGGRMLLGMLAPMADAGEGGFFGGFELRSTAAEVCADMDWSRWVLVQSNTLLADLPSRVIYRIDENGLLAGGEVRLNRNLDRGEDEVCAAALLWLEESYGVKATAQELAESKQWKAEGALISVEEYGAEICMTVSGVEK